MRYASFKYDRSRNLGDEIQTLATEQHLPRVDTRIDRDSLASFESDEKHVVIFQGWFSMSPDECFPPSDAIVPVFIGFHVTPTFGSREYLTSGASLDYLKAHAPIGCRDDGTRRLLERAGVPAYTTHCLTLTLPTREREPRKGKVFIVDGDDLPIPRALRRRAIRVTHDSAVPLLDGPKSAAARSLLDAYRDQARLVITTKLHCALPCLAMGIPVVFFGEDPDVDYRLGILRDLGVPIARKRPRSRRVSKACRRLGAVRSLWRLWSILSVDWDPQPLDLDLERTQLGDVVRWAMRGAAPQTTVVEADASRAVGGAVDRATVEPERVELEVGP